MSRAQSAPGFRCIRGGAMPPRIPDDQRAAILTDIKAGKPRNEIARKHGRSPGTISNIATDAGLTDAFDRTSTKMATEARTADNRAARSIEATESLTIASSLRSRILEADGGRDAQGWATAYGIMSDKHMAFEKFDAATGSETVGSLLGAMFDDLVAKHGDPDASAG